MSTFQKQGSIATPVEDEEPPVDLPESIQTNREAYAQGEWRKYPYAARCLLYFSTCYIRQKHPNSLLPVKRTCAQVLAEAVMLHHLFINAPSTQSLPFVSACAPTPSQPSTTPSLICPNLSLGQYISASTGMDAAHPSWPPERRHHTSCMWSVQHTPSVGECVCVDFSTLLVLGIYSVIRPRITNAHPKSSTV